MDREEAKQIIKQSWRDLITDLTEPAKMKVNGQLSYICPMCGHGTHGDGLTVNKRSKNEGLKCFGCNFSGDIIELYQKAQGIEFNEAFTLLANKLNLTIDGPGAERSQADPKTRKASSAPARESAAKVAPVQLKKSGADQEEQPADFSGYIQEVQKHIDEAPAQVYLNSRGISAETAKRYGLGYDAAYKTFNKTETGQEYANWRGLVIPTSRSCYIVRNIDPPKPPEKENRYRKKGKYILFNIDALQTAQKPICIVEGEIDALSIIEAGGEAVGLGSTSNKDKLIEAISQQDPAQPLILALDADEHGQPAEEWIAGELQRLQIPFYRASLYNGCKDANEALQKDKKALTEAIQAAELSAEDAAADLKAEQEAELQALKNEYMRTSAAYCMEDFLNGISEKASTPAISTGFRNLDNLLDGGLYPGLYIIGAISSLGKTSFTLQIIDQIAQAGQDCIIFSLEMAKEELIAKSVSRITYRKTDKRSNAKTTRGILAGARYEHYNQEERQLIADAETIYFNYAQHIYIHEGVGDIGISQIAETVRQHIKITGNRPVVLIDYLQILAPVDIRATDKQNTDKAVLELKRLSRDCKIPIIGISSFNRDNYSAPVNTASFKESGAIEYSADVLIGLQYEGMDYREDETEGKRAARFRSIMRKCEENAKSGEPQTVELKVLKNRNGGRGSINFSFYAMFNDFREGIPLEKVPLSKSRNSNKTNNDIFTSIRPD